MIELNKYYVIQFTGQTDFKQTVITALYNNDYQQYLYAGLKEDLNFEEVKFKVKGRGKKKIMKVVEFNEWIDSMADYIIIRKDIMHTSRYFKIRDMKYVKSKRKNI